MYWLCSSGSFARRVQFRFRERQLEIELRQFIGCI
jgi:hypothetical protein